MHAPRTTVAVTPTLFALLILLLARRIAGRVLKASQEAELLIV